MSKERWDVIVLGRKLGTADGWDGDLGEMIWFYNFRPAEGVELPECSSLGFDQDRGLLGSLSDETGDFEESPPRDAVTFLAKLKREDAK